MTNVMANPTDTLTSFGDTPFEVMVTVLGAGFVDGEGVGSGVGAGDGGTPEGAEDGDVGLDDAPSFASQAVRSPRVAPMRITRLESHFVRSNRTRRAAVGVFMISLRSSLVRVESGTVEMA